MDREVASLEAGQFFGEMSLMTGEVRSATIMACSEVECYVVDKSDFAEILTANPKLAEDISAILAARQRSLNDATAGVIPVQASSLRSQVLSKIATFFGLR